MCCQYRSISASAGNNLNDTNDNKCIIAWQILQMAPIVNYLLTFIYVVSMEIKNAIIRIKCGVEVKSPNDAIIENCVKHEASYCKYRF